MAGSVARKLAVIVHADVAGSTVLVERNEGVAHERIRAMFSRFSSVIHDYGGTAREIRGDALVAEFSRASDAVAASLIFQASHDRETDSEPDDIRPVLRIGVSLGEVIIADGTITGTGVVLAQRLEQLAAPGQVVVQGSVFETVPTRLPYDFQPLGEHVLKGFAQPVRAFLARMRPGEHNFEPEFQIATENEINQVTVGPGAMEKPSIAVLPFENLSGDPGQQYFADGMVEEIVTGLSRVRWMTVIARNSSFAVSGQSVDTNEIARRLAVRYLIGGSVRQSGNRLRITVRLIESDPDKHLWVERFEGDLADVFDLQDRITAGIVGAIEPSVRQAEIARVKRKRPDDLGVYDLYLRAVSQMYEVSASSRAKAMEFADQALSIDPDYAEAHGVAAWCCFARSLWEGELTEEFREKALYHAKAVKTLQSTDATTLAHAAIALAMATRDFDSALELIDRAIAINPNSAHAHGHGAVINTWAGRYQTAIQLAEQALSLSPFEPLAIMPLAATAGARLMLDDFDGAISMARRALQIYPTHAPSHLIKIASLMRSGRLEDAHNAARGYIEVAPSYRIGKRGFFLPGFDADFRAAGLPQ